MNISTAGRVRALAAAGILAAAGTGLTAVAVNAQQPTPSATVSATISVVTGPKSAGPEQGRQHADEYLARLAQNLGVGVDRLKDALKQTALQELDAAVARGDLTSAQAEEVRGHINSGALMMFGPGFVHVGHGEHGGPGGLLRAAHDEIAQFLGITAEQLGSELNGKSLAQVAQAHGKTRETLIEFLVQSATIHINAEVTAGRLTQQQANEHLAELQNRIAHLVDLIHQHSRLSGVFPASPSPTATPRP